MATEGTILSAGDGASRAMPVPEGLVLDVAGHRLEVRHAPNDNEEQVTITGLQIIEPMHFDRCPICLTPNPTSKEHIPPRSVGGRVMTLTCKPCNSDFGGRVEPDLYSWCLDALVNTRASGTGAPGRRRLPTVYRRETQDGQFILLVEGEVDPAVTTMLDAGDLTWEVRLPQMLLVRAAALKSAYLAACLTVRGIPDSPTSRKVRDLLRATRDGASPAEADPDGMLSGVRLARTLRAPREHPVLLGHDPANPSGRHIVLAGRIAVSWPLDDVDPDSLLDVP